MVSVFYAGVAARTFNVCYGEPSTTCCLSEGSNNWSMMVALPLLPVCPVAAAGIALAVSLRNRAYSSSHLGKTGDDSPSVKPDPHTSPLDYPAPRLFKKNEVMIMSGGQVGAVLCLWLKIRG